MDNILFEFTNRYNGYPGLFKINKKTQNFISTMNKAKAGQLFDYALDHPRQFAACPTLVVLAFLHFIQLHPKRKLSSAMIPKKMIEDLGWKYQVCEEIALAAGRCYQSLQDIAGNSAKIKEIKHQTWKLCFSEYLYQAFNHYKLIKDHNVLILGEPGVGKELVARAIQSAVFWHRFKTSDGSSEIEINEKIDLKPSMLKFNITATPETLIDDELFGHIKGVFTDATRDRAGLLEASHNSSLFLDEIGDIPQMFQPKLLRAIQEKKIKRLGENEEREADVRFISATNRDVFNTNSGLREDLLQRLVGSIIFIPPLRDRKSDIKPIVTQKVKKYLGTWIIPDQIEKWILHEIDKLDENSFPNNVRELESALRRLLLGFGFANNRNVEFPISKTEQPQPSDPFIAKIVNCKVTGEKLFEWYLRIVLNKTKGNMSQAAKILDIDRNTIREKMKKYGMNRKIAIESET